MSGSPAGHVRGPGTGCETSTGAREGGSWGVTFLGEAYVDERELDRFAFEAGHYYDFRLAALVRQLREHRTMLRRYVTAHAAAAQAGTRQLPAATQALLDAYNDARALLSEPSPKTVAESSKSWVTVSRLAANDAASSVRSRSRP
jgi:hypothetical protein